MIIKISKPQINPNIGTVEICEVELSDQAYFSKIANFGISYSKEESDCIVDLNTTFTDGHVAKTFWNKSQILNWDEL